MTKKKVCMLGALGVGKTSLVRQFILGIFSEKYHSTIGVKIDQKIVFVNDIEVTLLLWDIHGENGFNKIKSTYFMGASGVILVIDGTRKETQNTARTLNILVKETIGDVPSILLINKSDLVNEWEFDDKSIEILKTEFDSVYITSAKSGSNVETTFEELTKMMIQS